LALAPEKYQLPVATYPSLVYLNGEFVSSDNARISPFDRGFVFGDGVYEVIPVYGRRLFRFAQHMDRLENSLAGISLKNPLSRSEWTAICSRLIESNGSDDQSIYFQVTRGPAPRDHAFPESPRATVFAYSTPLRYPDARQLAEGVPAITLPDIRWQRCDIKAIALLPNVMARQQATAAGAAEAILIRNGLMTEGSASNVFAVIGGHLCTPPKGQFILPGVTRDLILELAHTHGIAVNERDIPEDEMRSADELMLSSSMKEILAITSLDGKPVGTGKPGPLQGRLYRIYQDYIHEFRSGKVA